ncbi:TonB-dependent receptor [Luteithermobacter gelatinilyticus]|uniref:TonB-dependent receptor n=1 Tax=Luteithermobacter gelatinilyticus TaxID=2582913 RepID=UPI00143D0145|nr:TonB-dependent receptor [Luteithermobacter gelatinilyticus]
MNKYVRFMYYGVAYSALALTALPAAGMAENLAEESQDDGGSLMLEEITVTARKREENLQETPISITAFSSGGLEARGISDISEIGEFTPNLVFDNTAAIAATSSAAAIYIRGVGQIDWALPTDPGVGLYVDGVYIARSVGGVMDLLDVERVEVLKGPQGTLFGRNTIGGAISITTKKPHEELEGYGEVTIGSEDRTDVRFGINVPVSDTFFANFAGSRKKRNGYVKNLIPGGPELGDEDAWAGRAAFRWLASDTVEVNLAIDGTREREAPAANVLIGVDESQFFPLITNGALPLFTNRHGLPTPSAVCADANNPARLNDPTCWNAQWIAGPFRTYSTHTTPNDFVNTFLGRPMEPKSELDLWGISLGVDWDINESLTFKSITAYRELSGYWARDVDHSPLLILQTVNDFTQEQFTQEFQLLGNNLDGRLNWILGVYYFKEEGEHIDVVEIPGAVFDSGGSINNESKAVFGQATYDVTDQFSATVGFRWTDEDKRFTPDSVVAQDNGLGIPVGVLVLPTFEGVQADKVFDIHVNLAYRWTEDFMTYASFSEGFKGGTFTQRVFPPRPDIPSANPEKVKAYELGFKSTWADNQVRLNGAFFYSDYTDMQVNVTEKTPGGTDQDIGIITRNAAAAEIKGAELELIAVPDERWVVEAGLGYLDANYNELTGPAIAAGLTLNHQLVNTPEWSVNVGVGYTLDLGEEWTVTPRVDYAYTSKIANDAKNTPELIQDGLHLVNAALMFADQADLWNVNLGVRNLTDETYLVAGDNSTDGVIEGVYARPREWYLSVKRKF